MGGLDTIAMAKGKSAVMNNVCKSEEGGSKGKEMGGGAGSCLLRSCLLCHFFSLGLIVIIDLQLFSKGLAFLLLHIAALILHCFCSVSSRLHSLTNICSQSQ